MCFLIIDFLCVHTTVVCIFNTILCSLFYFTLLNFISSFILYFPHLKRFIILFSLYLLLLFISPPGHLIFSSSLFYAWGFILCALEGRLISLREFSDQKQTFAWHELPRDVGPSSACPSVARKRSLGTRNSVCLS